MMRKILAYFGLSERNKYILSPTQQDNFGRNIFLFAVFFGVLMLLFAIIGSTCFPEQISNFLLE
jgi:hypothetical protein